MENNQNIGYNNYRYNVKWYNPNKFNPLDSSLAYLMFLVLFLILPHFFNLLIKLLISTGINDIYFLMCLSAIFSQSIIIGIVLIYSKITKINPYNGGGFRQQKNTISALMSVILIIGMLILFIPVTENFVESIYRLGGSSSNYNLNGNGIFALLYILVLSTVLPAICEELLFRGIILKGLLPYGKTFAIVMSSLMFALGHGSFSQLLYQFLVGLAIGTVVVMSKNIKIGMIMHFTNNLFASIYAILLESSKNISSKASYLSMAFFIAIGTVCFVAAIIYFVKYGINQYKKQILNEKSDSDFKSCLSYEKNFESSALINFDEKIRYSTKEEKIYFYHNKYGFTAMRRVSKSKLPVVLLSIGTIFAIVLIFFDYFAII
jgi:membrane protease YdiL (CAAX protease family)